MGGAGQWLGYEQRGLQSSSVKSTQLTPSKGEQKRDLPFLPAPVWLQFYLSPLFLWTQIHIKSNLASEFCFIPLYLFSHCNGRTNFWVVKTASSGWTRLAQFSSTSWFGAESQAGHLVKDRPALGSLAFSVPGWECQSAL